MQLRCSVFQSQNTFHEGTPAAASQGSHRSGYLKRKLVGHDQSVGNVSKRSMVEIPEQLLESILNDTELPSDVGSPSVIIPRHNLANRRRVSTTAFSQVIQSQESEPVQEEANNDSDSTIPSEMATPEIARPIRHVAQSRKRVSTSVFKQTLDNQAQREEAQNRASDQDESDSNLPSDVPAAESTLPWRSAAKKKTRMSMSVFKGTLDQHSEEEPLPAGENDSEDSSLPVDLAELPEVVLPQHSGNPSKKRVSTSVFKGALEAPARVEGIPIDLFSLSTESLQSSVADADEFAPQRQEPTSQNRASSIAGKESLRQQLHQDEAVDEGELLGDGGSADSTYESVHSSLDLDPLMLQQPDEPSSSLAANPASIREGSLAAEPVLSDDRNTTSGQSGSLLSGPSTLETPEQRYSQRPGPKSRKHRISGTAFQKALQAESVVPVVLPTEVASNDGSNAADARQQLATTINRGQVSLVQEESAPTSSGTDKVSVSLNQSRREPDPPPATQVVNETIFPASQALSTQKRSSFGVVAEEIHQHVEDEDEEIAIVAVTTRKSVAVENSRLEAGRESSARLAVTASRGTEGSESEASKTVTDTATGVEDFAPLASSTQVVRKLSSSDDEILTAEEEQPSELQLSPGVAQTVVLSQQPAVTPKKTTVSSVSIDISLSAADLPSKLDTPEVVPVVRRPERASAKKRLSMAEYLAAMGKRATPPKAKTPTPAKDDPRISSGRLSRNATTSAATVDPPPVSASIAG